MNQPKRASLGTIFLTVFIDLLGVGIIIPVIPALFFEEGAMIFDPGTSETYRSVLYGLLIASYPFMQFFGAPMLGALSDRLGRKPVLLVSLAGTLIGYLLFAVAILQQNLWLLFASRMLPGFTGGNVAVILSSIADVSDESSKARNFGLVGMAFGLGFILGPTLGGIMADDTVVSWFNAATPFFFTSILTVLNLIFVRFSFRETLEQKGDTRISPWTGFRNIATSFTVPRLRVIFSVVLLLSLGFSFFTQFFSVYLYQQFSFTEKSIGFLYGWIGLWLAFTQGFTVRKLSTHFRPDQLLSVTTLCLSFAIGALLLPDQSWMFYVLNPFVATFQGITSPNLTAVISSQVSRERQGQILGINQSMQSLGQMAPPLIAGYINAINGNLPLLTAATLTFLGWLVYVAVFRKHRAGG